MARPTRAGRPWNPTFRQGWGVCARWTQPPRQGSIPKEGASAIRRPHPIKRCLSQPDLEPAPKGLPRTGWASPSTLRGAALGTRGAGLGHDLASFFIGLEASGRWHRAFTSRSSRRLGSARFAPPTPKCSRSRGRRSDFERVSSIPDPMFFSPTPKCRGQKPKLVVALDAGLKEPLVRCRQLPTVLGSRGCFRSVG